MATITCAPGLCRHYNVASKVLQGGGGVGQKHNKASLLCAPQKLGLKDQPQASLRGL